MRKTIVSDTSCLILLSKINRLYLLELLFNELTITSIIEEEFGEKLPHFIRVEDPLNSNYKFLLNANLDDGEASAIALALEKINCLIIIDENKGRKEAERLKLNYTGTLGILITAKNNGLIISIKEILDEISNTDFRISDALYSEVIKICGESMV